MAGRRWIPRFWVLLLALAAPAFGDKKKAGGDPGKFIVSARIRWWVPQVDGSFQVNQRDVRGSYENYRQDLEMEAFDPRNNPGFPNLVLEGKLGNSSLFLDWMETSMQGDSWVDRMTFNGKEYVSEHILTDMDFRLYRLTYAKHLLDSGYLKGSFLIGIGYIDYRAEVEPDPGSSSEPTHTGGNAPYPYIGGKAVFRPPVKYLDVLEVLGEVTWSRGDWGDARLLYVDGVLGLNVRPVKFVSLGVGFRVFHLFADAINVLSDDPDTLLITLSGPYVELEARF